MNFRKNKIKESGMVVRTLFLVFIVLFVIAVLYPILNVLAVSFSSYGGYATNSGMIWPHHFTLESYKQVFSNEKIWSGYGTTLIVTVAGTMLGLVLTILTSYSLSKSDLRGKKIIMSLILFTMFFSGGMIPNYFLIKNLHLLDSRWALIIPGCLTAYNIILMKNFFESLPQSLLEAAKIDGATEIQVLQSIVIPLSKPIISVISLYLAVGYWNSYFNGILYIKSQSKWPLQLVLREIITAASTLQQSTEGNLAEAGTAVPAIMLQYAAIVVAMVPILCIYPFIQKYFEKGVMIGAVKG